MEKEIEIPEGYEARIEGNKVMLKKKQTNDEWVRERLLSLVRVLDSLFFGGNNPSREQCLAYLEKQKEYLPIPDKFSGLKSLMLQYLYSAANRKDDTEIESDTDLWGRKILDYVWKYDGLQKEQKPAEWSEEDETALDDLIWCIEQARKCAKNENDMGNIWFAENWVKNRLKSFRPQPTWKPSEEQMKIFNEAVEHYSRYWDSEEIKILCSLYDDLKKL